MESYSDLVKRYSSTGARDDWEETVIIICKKPKKTHDASEYIKHTPSKSGIEELALKPTKFYRDRIGLSS